MKHQNPLRIESETAAAPNIVAAVGACFEFELV
jgi:hypothetical protein